MSLTLLPRACGPHVNRSTSASKLYFSMVYIQVGCPSPTLSPLPAPRARPQLEGGRGMLTSVRAPIASMRQSPVVHPVASQGALLSRRRVAHASMRRARGRRMSDGAKKVLRPSTVETGVHNRDRPAWDFCKNFFRSWAGSLPKTERQSDLITCRGPVLS
jgi:hypothetical protein